MAKPPVVSAGVLAWRRRPEGPQVLLVRPGGPYWQGKDEAAWGIPKGIVEAGELGWAAAQREFLEELGQPIDGTPVALTPCKLSGGKILQAWMVEADLDVADLKSNVFELEWPPRSGRRQPFPEVDQAAWFTLEEARPRIHKGQRGLLEEAIGLLSLPPGGSRRDLEA